MQTENDTSKPEDSPQQEAGEGCSGATCSAWTPITEKMPKPTLKVMVCGHYNNGNRWRALARWMPAGSIDATMWDDQPDDWWDEDGDKCTNPTAGWWEESIELEVMAQLENVTHWMALPSMPNASAMAPATLELESKKDVMAGCPSASCSPSLGEISATE